MSVRLFTECGKATVCFDLLESRRTAGDTAVFVERDDPAEFAEAIEKLLDDAQRMCERGMQRGKGASACTGESVKKP